MNAGLLAFPVIAVFAIAYRRRVLLIDAEKMVWIWMAALFIVFCLPSQRSARYLLEAMPGLAVLCALNWHRINRKVFVTSLLVMGCVLAFFSFMSLHLQQEMAGSELYGLMYWILIILSGALILIALFIPKSTAAIVNVTALMVLLCFAAFMRPFDGALGNYSAEAQKFAQGKDVWVPCNFRAKEEGYRFILPGAQIHGYHEDLALTSTELAAKYNLFVVQVPLQAEGCANCKILGQRLDIRGRQSDSEIKQMLKGEIFQHLFVKELLIEKPGVKSIVVPDEGCR
jgi:hypothetical protein